MAKSDNVEIPITRAELISAFNDWETQSQNGNWPDADFTKITIEELAEQNADFLLSLILQNRS